MPESSGVPREVTAREQAEKAGNPGPRAALGIAQHPDRRKGAGSLSDVLRAVHGSAFSGHVQHEWLPEVPVPGLDARL